MISWDTALEGVFIEDYKKDTLFYLNELKTSILSIGNLAQGNLEFGDYSFPEATKGRWIVMDAGDIDDDGDIDLALGSFVYFLAQGDTTGLGKEWLSTGPSVVVLENTTR